MRGERAGRGPEGGAGIDDAGKNIKQGVENAFARTKAAVHNQDVLSRVYSRLHWDKTLTNSVMEVALKDDGTITLRGGVPDAAAKERAVLLAKDTVGVSRVIDELAVLPPSSGPTSSTPSSKAGVKP